MKIEWLASTRYYCKKIALVVAQEENQLETPAQNNFGASMIAMSCLALKKIAELEDLNLLDSSKSCDSWHCAIFAWMSFNKKYQHLWSAATIISWEQKETKPPFSCTLLATYHMKSEENNCALAAWAFLTISCLITMISYWAIKLMLIQCKHMTLTTKPSWARKTLKIVTVQINLNTLLQENWWCLHRRIMSVFVHGIARKQMCVFCLFI